ncbi:cell wall metabolism sensor histidine kinase WalK [uncultured Cellulomonas sp.]|uniref:sensor histidine kinase n=1 Tax=uncultured Cellulomonas sp. TaxID=189682 RepID=UPI0026026ACB|nr:HAMP domain-containing sensor histidine kinase [uncultured Cellulomonas sp.]
MTRWTLRRRLVVVLVLLLAAVTLTMGAVSALALRGSLVAQLDGRLQESSQRAVRAQERPARTDGAPAPPGGERGEVPDQPPGLDVRGQGAGTVSLSVDDGVVRAGVIDAEGETRSLTEDQRATLASVTPGEAPTTADLGDLGAYRVVATTSDDGDLVVTGLSTQAASSTVRDYLLVEAGIAALGIVAAALAGGALVRRELRPLRRVAATATRVSELPLHEGEVALVERLPAADTDPATEVGQVGTALNRLLGHVEAALAARQASETQVRQFVADASHELRTPLASIRGYAELVRRMRADVPPDALRAMERVESESRRMTALVEDMLLLARLDAGRPLEAVPVDLVALAVDAVCDAHAAGPDHVWALDLSATPGETSGAEGADGGDVGHEDLHDDDDGFAPVVTVGDADRLRQVLVNLLANARVHTPAGTRVVTTVRRRPPGTSGTGGTVTVAVSDDGPGIPSELRGQLFQRFTRGDAARSPGSGSSGLGLAIVDAVVAAHGGRIDVDSGPDGTTFTVTLPAAPPP